MGAFEEVKGKVKQAAGDVTNDPDLRNEGLAQEQKGLEERQEDAASAEASEHRAKAQELDREQAAAERR